MDAPSPRIRALLRQAKRTEESGKRSAAEQLYRQIVDEAPSTLAGWEGLARVSGDDSVRDEALQQVQALDGQGGWDETEPEDTGDESSVPAVNGDDEEPSSGAEEPWDPYARIDEILTRKVEGRDRTNVNARQAEEVAPQATVEAPQLEVEQPAAAGASTEEDGETKYCYRHPKRATSLRCITCSRPICMQCARHTPVGYRCPQCIREAQDVFFSAGFVDYLIVGVVTLVLAVLAGLIAPRLGFFVIFIGPAAGTLIGRAAFRVARRRHGRYLPHLVAALVAIGGLLPTGLPLLLALTLGGASITSIGFGLLWPIVYVFLATGSAYYQVK